MGRALYAPLFETGPAPNIARFIFLTHGRRTSTWTGVSLVAPLRR